VPDVWTFLSTTSHCAMYGKPWLVLTHVVGNMLVFLAYVWIPLSIWIVMQARGMKFTALAWLFAAFILLCGLGHLWHLGTVFSGSQAWYWWRSSWDIVTGIVSITTAVYCWKLIPVLMRIPTPEEHEANKETIELYRDAERWRQLGRPASKWSMSNWSGEVDEQGG
jgi:two-component system sensor histidine kinase/response regulator